MDNKEILNSTLSDLYQIDPSLKNIEKEISVLIGELIKNKPKIMMDEEFKEQLKNKVLAKAQELKGQKDQKHSWRFILRPAAFVGAGAAVVLLVVLPWMFSKNGPEQVALTDPFRFRAQEVGENSFGKLALSASIPTAEKTTIQPNQPASTAQDSRAMVYGMGGPASNASGVANAGGGTATVPSPEMMPPVRAYNIKYVYKGTPVELSESQLKVYKRINEASQARLIGKMFANLEWGGLNLAKFANLSAQYITLKESGNSGYSIYLNFIEGMVSISLDQDMAIAVDNLDMQKSISALPKDASVMAIANNFLAKYGINADNHGAPEVQKQWIMKSCAMAENSRCYIPSTLSVLYPMLINGQPIYDQGGGKIGMNVSVDVANNKVTGLWNLKTQNYQSSLYGAVTDFNKILEAINSMYRPYYYGYSESSSDTIEVELGEPQRVYELITRYQNGKTEEFVVPALLFSIKQGQASQYYYTPENIVVPLITEMLDFQNQGPYPVPMMESAPSAGPDQAQTK